jgi:hypothetical protein
MPKHREACAPSDGGLVREVVMVRLSFGQLPLLVRVATGVALFNAWVSFEEFVVDRVGLWRYMPYYRVAQGCVWDLVVAALIVVGLTWASIRSPVSSDARIT